VTSKPIRRPAPRHASILSLALVAALAAASAAAQTPAPRNAADGVWTGQAAGGACAPLTVRIVVEGGLVDGTASEPDSGGARVQGKKGERLPPPPALWQLNGAVAADGSVKLTALRAMRERERQNAKWTGKAAGGSLTVAEIDGPCRRSATLARGR